MRKRLYKARLLLIMTFVLTIHNGMYAEAKQGEKEKCGTDIVFVLDVSGSMKTNDGSRTTIEIIKMTMDLCEANHRFGLVAYNDTIAYSCELTDLTKKEEKKKLEKVLEQVDFGGETDIGLGLKEAVNMLKKENTMASKQMIVLISDGKTDLEKSNTGRTLLDSEKDINYCIETAKREDIAIHTISLISSFSEDVDYLTALSEKTGGISDVVASPLKLLDGMNHILYGNEDTGIETTVEIPANGGEQVLELSVKREGLEAVYFMILASGIIEKTEVISHISEIVMVKEKRYVLLKLINPSQEQIMLNFKSEIGTNVVISSIQFTEDIEKSEQILPNSIVVMKNNVPEKTKGLEENLCISNGSQVYDMEDFFYDDGLLSYEIIDRQGESIHASLEKGILEIESVSIGKSMIVVEAMDKEGESATTEIIIHSMPLWKYNFDTTISLVIIGMLVISVLIIVATLILFRKKKKPVRVLPSGILEGNFLNLKSKNEALPLKWDLSQCHGESVTLEELFRQLQLYEDLPQLDKIRFYFVEDGNLMLVHDTNGGVFIGNRNVEVNAQAYICSGDAIYIGFEDNASELELRYHAVRKELLMKKRNNKKKR